MDAHIDKDTNKTSQTFKLSIPILLIYLYLLTELDRTYLHKKYKKEQIFLKKVFMKCCLI